MDEKKIIKVNATFPYDEKRLQELGCDKQPFLQFGAIHIFKAEADENQVDELRRLSYVESVVPMPTYGV